MQPPASSAIGHPGTMASPPAPRPAKTDHDRPPSVIDSGEKSGLALSVADVMEQQAFQGQVVRLDKDRQFEWRIYAGDLKRVAMSLFRVATSPENVNYFTVNVSPDSDVGLRFE